jgi:N-acyl-L-homoserine lactone synthetase
LIIFKKVETEQEKNDIYRLRYEVYCREKNYLPHMQYPGQSEMDEYDPHSVHFIAKTGAQSVGTARLVLHNPIGFPMEQHYNFSITSKGMNIEHTAEISRLVVMKQSTMSSEYRKSKITWGLFRVMHQEVKLLGIQHLCAAMGMGLWRLLNRCNIPFSQIGLPKEYYGGVCAPFATNMKDISPDIFS